MPVQTDVGRLYQELIARFKDDSNLASALTPPGNIWKPVESLVQLHKRCAYLASLLTSKDPNRKRLLTLKKRLGEVIDDAITNAMFDSARAIAAAFSSMTDVLDQEIQSYNVQTIGEARATENVSIFIKLATLGLAISKL